MFITLILFFVGYFVFNGEDPSYLIALGLFVISGALYEVSYSIKHFKLFEIPDFNSDTDSHE